MTNGDVEIKDEAAFRATVAKLRAAAQALAKAKESSTGIADAATAAASKNKDGSGVATVYAGTVSSVGTAVGNVGKHVEAASTSVTSVADGLETWMNKVLGIDEQSGKDVDNT